METIGVWRPVDFSANVRLGMIKAWLPGFGTLKLLYATTLSYILTLTIRGFSGQAYIPHSLVVKCPLCSIGDCFDYRLGKHIVHNVVDTGMVKLLIHISPDIRIVGLDCDLGIGMESCVDILGILTTRQE